MKKIIKSLGRELFGLKWFGRRFKLHQERYYRRNRWRLTFDLILIITIIILAAIAISAWRYRPNVSVLVNQNLPERPEIDLNNPPLEISLKTATSSSLKEAIKAKINLHNQASTVIQDLNISFSVSTPGFNVQKIVYDDNQTGKQIKIAALEASSNQEIEAKIYLTGSGSRTVRWQADISYSVFGQIIKKTIALEDLKLEAIIKTSASLYYNSPQGDQLGMGPLPPLAGLPTDYFAFIRLESDSALEDVICRAKLATNVELGDDRSLLAGDFNYNQSSRQVVWKIGAISADNPYRLGFAIRFIPDNEQVGKTPILISDIACFGHDSLTNAQLKTTTSALDSSLKDDPINQGLGTVERQ